VPLGFGKTLIANPTLKPIESALTNLKHPQSKAWEKNLVLFGNSVDDNPHKIFICCPFLWAKLPYKHILHMFPKSTKA